MVPQKRENFIIESTEAIANSRNQWPCNCNHLPFSEIGVFSLKSKWSLSNWESQCYHCVKNVIGGCQVSSDWNDFKEVHWESQFETTQRFRWSFGSQLRFNLRANQRARKQELSMFIDITNNISHLEVPKTSLHECSIPYMIELNEFESFPNSHSYWESFNLEPFLLGVFRSNSPMKAFRSFGILWKVPTETVLDWNFQLNPIEDVLRYIVFKAYSC